jgi:hypothetical protein
MNNAMMQPGTIEQMLRTHPKQGYQDGDKLAFVARTLDECAAVCTICADACLSEKMVAELVRCIRLNGDCALICAAGARLLLRSVVEPQPSVIRHLLESCVAVCQACGQECARHAEMHEHCRICAESCRRCEDACRQMLSSM